MVSRDGCGFQEVSEGIRLYDFQDFIEGWSVLWFVAPAPTHQLIQLKRLWVILCECVCVCVRVRERERQKKEVGEADRVRERGRERV